MVVAISLSTGFQLFLAIFLSEIVAKFSMVLMASIGKSASIGSNSPFVELMKNRKKLAVTTIITLIPLIILGGTTGLIIFVIVTTFTLFLVAISSRSFGGITGDVLGSSNELTRLVSLLVFVSI
jgi:adenosylcobinamide-GDP ribazoletransferase